MAERQSEGAVKVLDCTEPVFFRGRDFDVNKQFTLAGFLEMCAKRQLFRSELFSDQRIQVEYETTVICDPTRPIVLDSLILQNEYVAFRDVNPVQSPFQPSVDYQLHCQVHIIQVDRCNGVIKAVERCELIRREKGQPTMTLFISNRIGNVMISMNDIDSLPLSISSMVSNEVVCQSGIQTDFQKLADTGPILTDLNSTLQKSDIFQVKSEGLSWLIYKLSVIALTQAKQSRISALMRRGSMVISQLECRHKTDAHMIADELLHSQVSLQIYKEHPSSPPLKLAATLHNDVGSLLSQITLTLALTSSESVSKL